MLYRAVLLLALLPAVAVLVAAMPVAMAAEPAATVPTAGEAPVTVAVRLQDGRAFTGLIDARSNSESLVLRFERGGAVLWRPIAWTDIADLRLEGKRLAPADLVKRLPGLATEARSKAERARLRPAAAAQEPPAEAKPPLPPSKTISISVDALLANWDADVEADGLVIQLLPIDQWHQGTLASGTLEVELYALQSSAFDQRPQNRGRSVQPIARWVKAVNVGDYTSSGAIVQLPFQAAHPEFNDGLGAYGLVHIKFSVPGSGVFERSIDGVRIRPWAPLRDYLQMDTGYRFLPHEGTGRGKTAWFTDDQ
jgi:hypothetical protein